MREGEMREGEEWVVRAGTTQKKLDIGIPNSHHWGAVE